MDDLLILMQLVFHGVNSLNIELVSLLDEDSKLLFCTFLSFQIDTYTIMELHLFEDVPSMLRH